MSEEFKLAENYFSPKIETIYGDRSTVRMGNIKGKFPMMKRIITEDNEIWDYFFEDGKTIWMYYATTFEEY